MIKNYCLLQLHIINKLNIIHMDPGYLNPCKGEYIPWHNDGWQFSMQFLLEQQKICCTDVIIIPLLDSVYHLIKSGSMVLYHLHYTV